MSQATDCCACPESIITEIPGSPGENGEPGADGANGVNAFTTLTIANTIPALVGQSSTYVVANSAWMAIGEKIFVSDGINQGTFEVVTLPSATSVELQWLQYPGDSAGGSALTVTATKLTPSGPIPVFSPPADIDATALTGVGAVASSTLAVGVGQFIHSIFFRAAAITGNVLLYTYTPGFRFRIVTISASVVDAITTGARAATLTTAINGTPTTGGVVIMSGAYALGTQQASSAPITALNVASAGQALTVTASSVTAFAEGGFILHMQLQNLDTANAVVSMNTSITAINATL